MFKDTVREERLLDKPLFIVALFFAVLALYFYVNLTQSKLGILLEPAIGNPAESGIYGRFASALTATVITISLIWATSRLSEKWQMIIVWLSLAALFIMFFASFNLSGEFMKKKTTLYADAGRRDNPVYFSHFHCLCLRARHRRCRG